ncbi:hypothetical protein D1610_14350 [Sphingomonas gilva]|uniref:DUF4398 domain-containing protein n=1 Tax=Sphingomonas gilva TaxID=2305907 RepID=A0A396RK41_9SPHN|nr:hypothetical protein [Sphingomonas gilva]RHW16578.1 hypothetical protein D1610_14350 [Sphingomonas gilva]
MRTLAALPLALAAVACSSSTGDFPELGVRPIESRGDEVQGPPPSTATADPAVAARARAIAAESADAGAAFDAALPVARAKAARAGPAGSETWIEAQLALTALDQARARTVSGLAEIDRLLVAEYAANRPVAPETAAVATELQVRAEQQAQAIEAVKESLAR